MSSGLSPRSIWFELIDSTTGKAYKDTCFDSVSLPSTDIVAHFRDAVKAKYADSHLQGIPPSALLVYKNKTAFDNSILVNDQGREESLRLSCLLNGLGETEKEEDMLVVSTKCSDLIGQVLYVSINENKLIKKYLTPPGSTPTPLDENYPQVTLQLGQLMFVENTIKRPCIVIDAHPDYDRIGIGGGPTITIVLITEFGGWPLDQIMARGEFGRIMPISPTPSQAGTATAIQTTPDWMSIPEHKIPSSILCIPIKVYPHNLSFSNDYFRLDAQNLEKLKLYILSLGGIRANADLIDSKEDSDEEEMVS